MNIKFSSIPVRTLDGSPATNGNIYCSSGLQSLMHSLFEPNTDYDKTYSKEIILNIYKGTKPTQKELNSMEWMRSSNAVPRSDDRLMHLVFSHSFDVNVHDFHTDANNPNLFAHTFSSVYATRTPTQSGQATWWLMQPHLKKYNSFLQAYEYLTNTLICGDVTDLGGNGEIRFPDPNLVAGTSYSIEDLLIGLNSISL